MELEDKFKAGDRVVRHGTTGPTGTVTKVRVEVVRTMLKQSKEGAEPPGVSVSVLWDNGTLSHFIPDGLEKLESSGDQAGQ